MDKSKAKLHPIFKEIKLDFTAYKKSADEPIKFYDKNYVRKYNKTLLGNIDKA
jgi:hypothetical protein